MFNIAKKFIKSVLNSKNTIDDSHNQNEKNIENNLKIFDEIVNKYSINGVINTNEHSVLKELINNIRNNFVLSANNIDINLDNDEETYKGDAVLIKREYLAKWIFSFLVPLLRYDIYEVNEEEKLVVYNEIVKLINIKHFETLSEYIDFIEGKFYLYNDIENRISFDYSKLNLFNHYFNDTIVDTLNVDDFKQNKSALIVGEDNFNSVTLFNEILSTEIVLNKSDSFFINAFYIIFVQIKRNINKYSNISILKENITKYIHNKYIVYVDEED